MVGIHGIGQTYEPANPRRAEDRNKNTAASATTYRDQICFSKQAQSAATITDWLSKSSDNDVRAEKLAEITHSLEQGSYRLQQVLLQTAARVSRYLPMH